MICPNAIHHSPLCKTLAAFVHTLCFWLVQQGHRLGEKQICSVTHNQRKKVTKAGVLFMLEAVLQARLYGCCPMTTGQWRYPGGGGTPPLHVVAATWTLLAHLWREPSRARAASPSPRSLPPARLTLHQLARPCCLRECCRGWRGFGGGGGVLHTRQSHWGHFGRGMGALREGGKSRKTRGVERDAHRLKQ